MHSWWDEWRLTCPDGSGSLYVTEKGEGEPLVVLHGGPGMDHRYLINAVERLTNHFRVVLYDRRGCLRSPVPLDKVAFEADVIDLHALQEQLGDGPIHLFGHSAGAHLAGAYVEAYPDLVGNVVLVGPPPMRTAKDDEERQLMAEQYQARARFENDQWYRLLDQLGYQESDLDRLGDREASHFWRMRDATLFLRYPERWRENPLTFFNREVSEAVVNSMPQEYDFVAALKRHKRKVTVIVGDHDVVDFGGRVAQYHFANSPVKLVILEDAGHNVWVDQPERFYEIVLDALRG